MCDTKTTMENLIDDYEIRLQSYKDSLKFYNEKYEKEKTQIDYMSIQTLKARIQVISNIINDLNTVKNNLRSEN